MILFDLSRPGASSIFHPLGDRIMGGVSKGGLADGRGCSIFSGEVSFENGGGFASIRSEVGSWDLSAFSGIALRVRGDGKVYKLSLTTAPRYGSVVYRARFTAPEKWSDVRLPFGEFSATYRGRSINGAPRLDPSRISTFGFLISDKQEGAFRLEIKKMIAF